MNQRMTEELACLTYSEWQRALDNNHSQIDFHAVEIHAPFTSRLALKLSDWLIASGKSLKQRHEKRMPASYQINVRKFAR